MIAGLSEVTAMNADEISQAVKRAILKNDAKVRGAQGSADDERGGRFASVNKAHVSGSEPATLYPRQPATSPWGAVIQPQRNRRLATRSTSKNRQAKSLSKSSQCEMHRHLRHQVRMQPRHRQALLLCAMAGLPSSNGDCDAADLAHPTSS